MSKFLNKKRLDELSKTGNPQLFDNLSNNQKRIIELACESDRIYFENHRGVSMRIRDALAGEFLPSRYVNKMMVLVMQIETGLRIRQAISPHDAILKLQQLPYNEYLKTEHWEQVRNRAIERAKGKCQLCSSSQTINVHHRTYEHRGFEKPEDVIVLCRDCHAKFHDKLH